MPQIVMSEILIEAPASLSPAEIAAAGERLRAVSGELAGIPPGLAALRRESLPRYVSSSGQLFVAAEGKALYRIEARLPHPANGSGRHGLDASGLVIAAALAELGGSRAIYGSTGIATTGCRDGFRACYWSAAAQAQLGAIAEVAASGLSWQAPADFVPTRR